MGVKAMMFGLEERGSGRQEFTENLKSKTKGLYRSWYFGTENRRGSSWWLAFAIQVAGRLEKLEWESADFTPLT